MKTAAVIVAAGAGLRAGGDLPKQYQKIGGKTVLRRTLEAFCGHDEVDMVQAVIGEDHDDVFAEAVGDIGQLPPVKGGASRQHSVRNGLEALVQHKPDLVLIHDAARPFVTPDLISRLVGRLKEASAVIPGLPVADTLKRVTGSEIGETVAREGLWAVQTPQAFRFDDILDAHRRAAEQQVDGLTDDAAVAEWSGLSVKIVTGETMNRKLTTADDIATAQHQHAAALGDVRVGQGYDVHAFEPGDHVILCGVKIDHEASLKGHSDADVAMHALTDAILGGLADGDIGAHFPPSEAEWKAADSAIFLKAAGDLVARRGGLIAHCDVTIVCEAPKLRPYIDAMRTRLAEILAIAPARVSVKATTSEQLGFTGRREGIAAHATATLRLPFDQ